MVEEGLSFGKGGLCRPEEDEVCGQLHMSWWLVIYLIYPEASFSFTAVKL